LKIGTCHTNTAERLTAHLDKGVFTTPTMGNPSSDPGSQGECNIGQPPGNPGDNGYPGGPVY